MTDWPRGGYPAGDTPASELKPPPEALRSMARMRAALRRSACVLCGHTLIDHHEASLRCQHRSKRHWWSRVQCPCDMTRRTS